MKSAVVEMLEGNSEMLGIGMNPRDFVEPRLGDNGQTPENRKRALQKRSAISLPTQGDDSDDSNDADSTGDDYISSQNSSKSNLSSDGGSSVKSGQVPTVKNFASIRKFDHNARDKAATARPRFACDLSQEVEAQVVQAPKAKKIETDEEKFAIYEQAYSLFE